MFISFNSYLFELNAKIEKKPIFVDIRRMPVIATTDIYESKKYIGHSFQESRRLSPFYCHLQQFTTNVPGCKD